MVWLLNAVVLSQRLRHHCSPSPNDVVYCLLSKSRNVPPNTIILTFDLTASCRPVVLFPNVNETHWPGKVEGNGSVNIRVHPGLWLTRGAETKTLTTTWGTSYKFYQVTVYQQHMQTAVYVWCPQSAHAVKVIHSG